MSVHSVLLEIATQSLTIGYFGSDIRNDPGHVRSPHANVWAGLSMHVSASICVVQHHVPQFFLENTSHNLR